MHFDAIQIEDDAPQSTLPAAEDSPTQVHDVPAASQPCIDFSMDKGKSVWSVWANQRRRQSVSVGQ